MALPPICHFESKSKMSAPGHIAIGTCTRIGCNGCPSHFPFRMSSDHFTVRNELCSPINVRSATKMRASNLNGAQCCCRLQITEIAVRSANLWLLARGCCPRTESLFMRCAFQIVQSFLVCLRVLAARYIRRDAFHLRHSF